MKRRTTETGKQPRRPVKRTPKFADSVYGSSFVYVKFLLVWMFILLADFILEFRFEYVWPFWLLIQSVYDKFKYQGLAYSVFFVCIAITSDTVCMLFIPIQWLFFMASTYVWIHYVWHTDRGFCFPTVILWIFFMYIETTMRLRDLKNSPFHIELCRPFAAHCIGHPVVTLGIGLQSCILHRLRLRTQRSVQKENNFYFELIKNALPKELQQPLNAITLPEVSSQPNGIVSHATNVGKKSNDKKEEKRNKKEPVSDETLQIAELPSTSPKQNSSAPSRTHISSSSGRGSNENLPFLVHDTTTTTHETNSKRSSSLNHHKKSADSSPVQQNKSSSKGGNGSPKTKDSKSSPSSHSKSSSTSSLEDHRRIQPPSPVVPSLPIKDPLTALTNGHLKNDKTCSIGLISTSSEIEKLENIISKLKVDLQNAKKSENNFRVQIDYLSGLEKNFKNDLFQLRKENELLQTKNQSLLFGKEKDKSSIQTLEKRLKVESDNRSSTEKLLKEEKRKRKEEEECARNAVASAAQNTKDKETLEVFRKAKKDLEEEVCLIQKRLKTREEEYNLLKSEVTELQSKEKTVKESETLMSALEAMQDKNLMLENSLSAETRLKLDLFSALGDVKRQLELAHGAIYKRDAEISELKARLTEFLSILPDRIRSGTPHYSNNFLEESVVPALPHTQEYAYHAMGPRSPSVPPGTMIQGHGVDQSMMAHLSAVHLDPNAAMYTPNTSGV